MIRLIIAGAFILAGLFMLGVAVVGMFRFSTMLNRLHVLPKCDTLGAMLLLLGLMIFSGFTFFSLKIFLLMMLLMLTKPIAANLVAHAEVETNQNLNLICDFEDLTGEKTNDNN
ncbi:MAG: monovalent cation/H(+) antiporter subunit G [Synergistaceae bacterium]|nr:monovalent cation/H(+) antiporter subunit G [Synergistaceae bacterium]